MEYDQKRNRYMKRISILICFMLFFLFSIVSVQGALLDDIQLYYSFDSGNISGTTVENVANPLMNGTFVNTFGSGITGARCGSGECVDVNTDGYIDTGFTHYLQNYTMCMYVSNTTLGTGAGFFGTRVTGSDGMILKKETADLIWNYQKVGSNTQQRLSSGAMGTNTQYLCFRRFGTGGGELSIMVNGTNVTMGGGSSNSPFVKITGEELRVARNINYYCPGCYIDEVAYWNRSLSESEVELMYNNTNTGCTYPFTSCSTVEANTTALRDMPDRINITLDTPGDYFPGYQIIGPFGTGVQYNMSYYVLTNITNSSSWQVTYNTSLGETYTANITNEAGAGSDVAILDNLTIITKLNQSNLFEWNDNKLYLEFDANMSVDIFIKICTDIDYIACNNGDNTSIYVLVNESNPTPNPAPVLILNISDRTINASTIPMDEPIINFSDHFANYTGSYVFLYNTTDNSTINTSGLNSPSYTFAHYEIFINQTSITLHGFLPVKTNITVYVNNTNTSVPYVSDTFALTVINGTAPIPILNKTFPDRINMSGNQSVTYNLTEYTINWTSALIEFINPSGVNQDISPGESREYPEFNLTYWPNGDNFTVYSFFIDHFFNINITYTSGGGFVNDSFNININVSEFAPNQTQNFSDINVCVNETQTYNFTQYYNNLDNITILNISFSNPHPTNTTPIVIDLITQSSSLTLFDGLLFLTFPDVYQLMTLDIINYWLNTFTEHSPITVTVTAGNEYGEEIDEFNITPRDQIDCNTPSGMTGIMSTFLHSWFGGMVDIATSIFPDSNSVSTATQYAYVIITMLLITFFILILGFVSDMITLGLILAGAIDFLLFIYFIAIGYIGIGVLVILILALLGIGYFRLRGGE